MRAARQQRLWRHARNSLGVIIFISIAGASILRLTGLVAAHGSEGVPMFGREVSSFTSQLGSRSDAIATNFNSSIESGIGQIQARMVQRDLAIANTLSTAGQQAVAHAVEVPNVVTAPIRQIQPSNKTSDQTAATTQQQTQIPQGGTTKATDSNKNQDKASSKVTVASPQEQTKLAKTMPALPDYRSKSGPPTTPQVTPTGGYSYGQCTYYVAKRRPVGTRWGNARDWMAHAKAEGYLTGSIPVAGAVAWTPQGWYGHVAYVEQVDGGQVLISEMNFAGWNRVSRRWVAATAFGYIYGKPQ